MTDFIDLSNSSFTAAYVIEEYKGNFRYLILEKIGSGSYGNVFKAINLRTKLTHAIKMTSRFYKENKVEIDNYIFFSKLKDYEKYFPKIYQIFDNYKDYYIIMEEIQGGHMNNRLISVRQTSMHEIVPMIKHLINILAIVHDHKRVLNDLKPENIMINHNDGKPRIIDLGLVTEYGNPKQCHMGSPLYLAPETYKKVISDDKKDIWALGISLYEFITGKNPFENCIQTDANNDYVFDMDLLDKAIEEANNIFKIFYRERDSKEDRSILRKIGDLIFKCLTKNYNDRPSAKDLLEHKLFIKKKREVIRI
jgi:serine/threonine protein kinase